MARQSLVGIILYPVRSRKRILENIDLGRCERENYKQQGYDAESYDSKPRVLADSRSAFELSSFIYKSYRRRNKEDRDIDIIGR